MFWRELFTPFLEFMSWGLRSVSIWFFLFGNRHTFYLSHLSTSKQNYHLFLTSLDSIHCLATLCLRRYAAHQLDLERSWKHSSLRRVTFFKLKTLRVTFAPALADTHSILGLLWYEPAFEISETLPVEVPNQMIDMSMGTMAHLPLKHDTPWR